MSYSAIFSVFLLFYLKFTLSDNLIAVKSLSCCDRGQFSPFKYFDFTTQNYRIKYITNHIQELRDFQMGLGVICVLWVLYGLTILPTCQKQY